MADFTSLKQTIQSYVKQNGNEEITGNILQDVLLAMVSTMGDGAINAMASALQNEAAERQNQDGILQGNINTLGGRIDTLQTAINGINTKLAEGYIYAGIATPSTNPGNPSGKVFYVAVQSGTYTYFSGVSVTEGITILKNNGTTWINELIQGIDDVPTAGSYNLVKSGGIFLSEFSRDFAKPIFDPDSDFSVYNGIRIYDIQASEPVTMSDRLELDAIGVLGGTYIEILIGKNGGRVASDYLAELSVPLSSITQTGIQTLTVPHYGNNTTDYYITLNVDDLKSITNVDYNTHRIYINKDYLNSKFGRLADFISVPDAKYNDAVQFVKADFYVDDSIIDTDSIDSMYLVSFQYASNILSLGIGRNNSNGKVDMYYVDKSIIGLASLKGKQTLIFGQKDEQVHHFWRDADNTAHDVISDGTFRFVITIDMELYRSFQYAAVTTFPSAEDMINVPLKKFSELGIVNYANRGADLKRFYQQVNGTLTGNYVLSDSISIGDNRKIYGSNCKIMVLDNGSITLGGNGSSIQGIFFYSNWTVPHNVNPDVESGIDPYYSMTDLQTLTENYNEKVLGGKEPIIKTVYSNCCNSSIKDCLFANLDRACLGLYSLTHRSSQQPYVSGCYFAECRTAISISSPDVAGYGEFIKITNCSVDNCLFGFVVGAGNNNTVGCILKRCDCALYLYDNGNDLHGEFVSNQIAHCPLNGVYVKSGAVNLGHLFIGCHIADAGIEGDVVNSLIFDGCKLETWFNFASGHKNSIVNSNLTDAYAVKYSKTWFAVPSDTNMKNNRNIKTANADDSLVNN